jgi:hypothetical protein
MSSLKTTLGGIVILAALAMLWTHILQVDQAVTLMGMASAWIGYSAKDSDKK